MRMKKSLVLKCLILLIALSNYLLCNEALRKVSLLEYIEIVSFATSKPIYISENIDALKISFFIPVDIEPFTLLETLDATLKTKKLHLEKLRNIYIVSKIKEVRYRSFKFRHLNPSDINSTLSVFDNVKFSYIPSTNTVLYSAPDNLHVKIKEFLLSIDIDKPQTKIKLTVFTTDLTKLVNIGSKIEGLSIDLNTFVSSVFSTKDAITSLNSSNSISFKTSLNYLRSNGVSTIEQSPILTLLDGKESSVSYADTVPFQTSTTSVSDGTATTQEVTEYRDVGLIIKALAKIQKNYTFLTLNLTSETLLTTGDKPTTRKINYTQSFKLKKDEILVLTGLTRDETFNQIDSVPLLGDLPLLEYLFKNKSINQTKKIITVMVEHV